MSLSCIHFLSVLHCYSNVPFGPLRWYFDTSEFCPSWPATTVSSLEVCLYLRRTTARAEIHARSTALPGGRWSVYRYIWKLKFQRPEVCPSLQQSVPIIPVCTRQQPGLDGHGKGRGGSRPGNRSNRSNRSDRSRASPIEIARVTGSEKFLTILNN